MKYRKTQFGFTLTEILVVVAIIGSLSAIVLASLNKSRDKGENATIVKQVREYITALQLTYVPNGNEFPWNGGSNLNQYGCLTDTIGGGCLYNDAPQPMYPDLSPLPNYISLAPMKVITVDGQADRFDSVLYSSDGQTFRLRYTLTGELANDIDCGIENTQIVNVGGANFPDVTVCQYESR